MCSYFNELCELHIVSLGEVSRVDYAFDRWAWLKKVRRRDKKITWFIQWHVKWWKYTKHFCGILIFFIYDTMSLMCMAIWHARTQTKKNPFYRISQPCVCLTSPSSIRREEKKKKELKHGICFLRCLFGRKDLFKSKLGGKKKNPSK